MKKTPRLNDPRVTRTKQLLVDALLDLTQHTKAGDITVKQLADKAKVDRKTFYRHFAGMPDFLNHVINNVFDYLQHTPQKSDFRSHDAAIIYYTGFFEAVRKNKVFFSSMLGQNGLPDFRERFRTKRRTWHTAMLRSFHGEFNQSVDSELLAATFIAVLLSMIEHWLHHEFTHSSEYMADQLVRLTHDRVLVAYECV